jgi:hypothetical protein
MLSKVVVPRAAHQWWRAGHGGGPGGAGTSKKTFCWRQFFYLYELQVQQSNHLVLI